MRHLSFAQYLCTFITIQHSSQAHPPTQPCFEHESCVCSMPSLPDSPPSFPPPIPVEPHPYRASGSDSPGEHHRELPDPNRLAPEDAYFAPSLLKARAARATYDDSLRTLKGNGSASSLRRRPAVPNADEKEARKVRGTSQHRRRRKGAWKKLLWVKQSCTTLPTLRLLTRVNGRLTWDNNRSG